MNDRFFIRGKAKHQGSLKDTVLIPLTSDAVGGEGMNK